jgi:hypothetical protein
MENRKFEIGKETGHSLISLFLFLILRLILAAACAFSGVGR